MRYLIFSLFFLSVFSSVNAFALPGDYDMYRQQSLEANEVARSPVKGTVPRGFKPFIYKTVEDAQGKLKNPVKKDLNSIWRGRRLYSSNCQTCHGKKGDGKGPVGPQLGVPNILTDYYANTPDGRVFAVITLGLRNMPRYGYKFSEKEKWDLANYIRFLQKKVNVPEISRPTADKMSEKMEKKTEEKK